MLESSIRIIDLSHTYTHENGEIVQALNNINLTLTKGEFVSIVGPSGCGKSTLMNIAGGLTEPTRGAVRIDEKPVLDALRMRKIGMVFQNPVLFPWRNTNENIRLPFELIGESSGSTGLKISALLDLVKLRGFGNSFPNELSGGMRSRVAIARSLALEPSILLMDEPFGSLDELTAHNLNIELLRIWSEKQPTVLFVTHSVSQSVFLSDRVIVLSPRPGRVIHDLKIELLRPRTEETLRSSEYIDLNGKVRESLNSCRQN